MKVAQKRLGLGLVGAVLSSVATSGLFLAVSCCAGHVVFMALGLGFASISTIESFASYRWIFFTLTIAFLSVAFLQIYKKERMARLGSSCSTQHRNRNRVLLVLFVLFIATLLIFPFAFEKYLLLPK